MAKNVAEDEAARTELIARTGRLAVPVIFAGSFVASTTVGVAARTAIVERDGSVSLRGFWFPPGHEPCRAG